MLRFALGSIGLALCLAGLILPIGGLSISASAASYDITILQDAPLLACLFVLASLSGFFLLLVNEESLFKKSIWVICGLFAVIIAASYFRELRVAVAAAEGTEKKVYYEERFLWQMHKHRYLLYGVLLCIAAARKAVVVGGWMPLPNGEISLQKLRLLFSPAERAEAAAVAPPVSDVGECAECGTRNSKSATRCYSCAATLPWVASKQPKAKQPQPLQSSALNPIAPSAVPVQRIGEIAKLIFCHLLTFHLNPALFPDANYWFFPLQTHEQ